MLKPHPLSPGYQNNRILYLVFFLSLNLALSCLTLSASSQFILALFGVGIPLWVVWKTPSAKGAGPFATVDSWRPVPSWIFLLVFAVALALRFIGLQTLPGWPNLDEGWITTLALELSRHWRWKFFFTFGQSPPLTVWLTASLFRLGSNPFLGLWLPAALVSVLTLLSGYWAAKHFLPKSLAFIFSCLLGFSFWPLLIGRICHQGISIPLFEFLCLLILGAFLHSKKPKSVRMNAFLFGLCAGLGSVSFTPWLMVCLLLSAVFWFLPKGKKTDRPRSFFWFLTGLIAGFSPFLLGVLSQGFGGHISSVAAWSGWFPWKHQGATLWHYFTCLFWGSFDAEAAYTPVRWGFLNPLLGAFFWLGLLELVSLRTRPWVKWVLGSIPVLMLPGLLSMNVEAFRIVQVLPLLLFVTACGLLSALAPLPPSKRWGTLFLILVISTSVDLYNLIQPLVDYRQHPEDFGRPVKSAERLEAYQLLASESREKGPGLVFTDFDPNSFNDHTLSAAVYPFNAARNRSLDPSRASWAAVFVNVHFLPFLHGRFPEGRWEWVGRGLKSPDGGYLLGIIPVTDANRGTFQRWLSAHDAFQRADLERYLQDTENFDSLLEILRGAAPSIEGDRFLESVYWDKTAAYDYGKSDLKAHLQAYQQAALKGYPTADLFYKWGQLWLTVGNVSEAKKAFEWASRAPLDLTPAKDVLKALK